MESIYKKKQRQRNLIIVFFLVLLITLSILYFGYFKRERVPPPPQVFLPQKKIEIDFSILENPILKSLEKFEEIGVPSPEKVGKENPFLPIK